MVAAVGRRWPSSVAACRSWSVVVRRRWMVAAGRRPSVVGGLWSSIVAGRRSPSAGCRQSSVSRRSVGIVVGRRRWSVVGVSSVWVGTLVRRSSSFTPTHPSIRSSPQRARWSNSAARWPGFGIISKRETWKRSAKPRTLIFRQADHEEAKCLVRPAACSTALSGPEKQGTVCTGYQARRGQVGLMLTRIWSNFAEIRPKLAQTGHAL